MYKINSKILKTPISDGKILLLEPQKGLYFELNEVSVIVFEGLLNEISLNDISEKIIQKFDVSPEDVERDINELIENLILKNIVLPNQDKSIIN